MSPEGNMDGIYLAAMKKSREQIENAGGQETEPQFESMDSKERFKESEDQNTQDIQSKTKLSVNNITPEIAHQTALASLQNETFYRILRSMIGEMIVEKLPVTRVDTAIIHGKQPAFETEYGMTKEHFADIRNGNFTRFDIIPDENTLNLTFTKNDGNKAMRPIDDTILADLLNTLFSHIPESAPPDLQTEVSIK